jgi:16S rRNA (uracil1498-N3)-methyltransferase
MRIYRCFHDANFPTGARIVLDESEAQHLGSVRRAEVGDQVHLFNGRGVECAATIEEARKKSVTLLVGAPLRQQPTPPRRTVLAVAITKGSDYDDMLQRSIELGVTDFQPLLTDRTIVELDPFKIQKRLERWQRISIEALKQCERLWLPVLEPPLPLDEYLRQGSAPHPHRPARARRLDPSARRVAPQSPRRFRRHAHRPRGGLVPGGHRGD